MEAYRTTSSKQTERTPKRTMNDTIQHKQYKELKKIRRNIDILGVIFLITIVGGIFYLSHLIERIDQEYTKARSTVEERIDSEKERIYSMLEKLQDFNDKVLTVHRENGKYIISITEKEIDKNGSTSRESNNRNE